MRQTIAFKEGEWVATKMGLANKVDRTFWLQEDTLQGHEFSLDKQENPFLLKEEDYTDVGALQLFRGCVTMITGDLKTMQINPIHKGTTQIWFMGLTSELGFDLQEWSWGGLDVTTKKAFFNYSAQISYRAGLLMKPQENRLFEKMKELSFNDVKCLDATKMLWDNNKTAKL
jgi:hypothetical protein